MLKRRLGNSDLELTRIGLGTWAIGGGNWKFSWGPQDDRESIAAIDRALALGINWIDTAPAYGLGHCEEVVGQALRELKVKPIIATKCGRCWDDQRQLRPWIKRASVIAECEASLRRLGLDTIDLYQIHWPQPEEDIEEGWEAVQTLVQAGKIRYGGVSNFQVTHMERILPLGKITSLQPPYSMLTRGIEDEILPYCAAHDIGVVVYSPMQKGLLTGKVTQQWVEQLSAEDHRRHDANFQEPKLSRNLRIVEGLRAIADRQQRSVSQLAIAWTLRHPAVTAAIVGARRPDQIEETVAAGQWDLTAEDTAEIERLLAS
jgi:aryl-alcohol dehydrogenase-like predicted oxidoreductase